MQGCRGGGVGCFLTHEEALEQITLLKDFPVSELWRWSGLPLCSPCKHTFRARVTQHNTHNAHRMCTHTHTGKGGLGRISAKCFRRWSQLPSLVSQDLKDLMSSPVMHSSR